MIQDPGSTISESYSYLSLAITSLLYKLKDCFNQHQHLNLRRNAVNFKTSVIMLESIFNNPGLQHITENIFCNLNNEDLEVCRTVNQSCRQVLYEPMFWLKKFIRRGLSMKEQLDWTKAIQLTKYTNLEKNVLSYLKICSENERVVNLPLRVGRPRGLPNFRTSNILALHCRTVCEQFADLY